jgi:hypothetical protein
MSDDRAESPRQNRNRAKQRANSGDLSADGQSETSNLSQPSESSKPKATGESESSATREDIDSNSLNTCVHDKKSVIGIICSCSPLCHAPTLICKAEILIEYLYIALR